MKLCWDNINDIRLTKNGNLRHKRRGIIYEKDKCCVCKESYLGKEKDKCCSRECSIIITSNFHEGRQRTEETKRKISEKAKLRIGDKNPNYNNGNKIRGDKNPNWKGGYHTKGLPLFSTYEHQLKTYDDVRSNKKDKNILEIKCTYCGGWFIPPLSEISYRISAIRGQRKGYSEHRLYCSNNCKQECPIFWKQKWPKGFKLATSREVQPELRQLVFKRDNYQCVKCVSEGPLHCHHITGIELNPIESADVDNCITLCKKCHQKVHKQDGCKYNDMKRERCLNENQKN